jgi:hypothetical protein
LAERNFDEEFAYDEAEGHTFVLGGYTFHTPPVARPGAFLNTGRGLMGAVRFLRAVIVPEDRANLERVLEMSDTSGRLIDLAPDLLSAATLVLAAEEMSDDEESAVARKEAFSRLREVVEQTMEAEEPGPAVSVIELDKVVDWLTEVTIGRPLVSPSSSGNGDERTSNGSKGISRKAARAGKT